VPGGDQNQRSEPQSGVRDAVIDEPGLRRAVGLFLQSRPGKAADIEAETLAAFLPPWSAASRAERASRLGCAGWRASAPVGWCKARGPSAPGRAQILSPPRRPDRRDTLTL